MRQAGGSNENEQFKRYIKASDSKTHIIIITIQSNTRIINVSLHKQA